MPINFRILVASSACLILITCFQVGCHWQMPDTQSRPVPFAPDNSKIRYQDSGADFENPNQDALKNATQADHQVDRRNLVNRIQIKGNRSIPAHELMRHIRTRKGRFYDPDQLQQDVEDLSRMKRVMRVNRPVINRTENGVEVTIEIIERRYVSKVEYIGNRSIHDWTLKKQSGIKEGEPLDIHEVKMARQRLETFYREKGYSRTQVEIVQGDDLNDDRVVFLIHEDKKQRIFYTDFVGNEIASDARLRHFIKSKPGIAWIFGGNLNRDQIQQDQTRIVAYYRSLGYFNARVGRELVENESGWVTVRFIIDEGPRYKVRNVSFAGNARYRGQDLATLVKLKPNNGKMPEFNAARMAKDENALRDMYGTQGHVFASVKAEPRFLEEPGMLDIVYKIQEGKQYRVGNINVHITGDYGVTKREVVLNRLGLKPGDLIDSRKLRNSERRLISTQIFAGGQGTPGPPPRIVVRPPELRELERMAEQDSAGFNR